jgi:hypothetical protein
MRSTPPKSWSVVESVEPPGEFTKKNLSTPLRDRARRREITILSIVVGICLSACSKGSSPATPIPGANPAVPVAATSHGTITIGVPRAIRTNSSSRKPSYISSATTHAAVFINAAASAAGSTTSCSSSACTIAWSFAGAVPASYSFAVEIDTGAGGSPANTVMAENEATYAIHAGSNTLPTLTLNGVAASALLTTEGCTGTSCTGTVGLSDAAGQLITNVSTPLATGFDNGPLTFTSVATATGTVTAGGTITQPTASGTSAYTVACSASTGSFLTTITPQSVTGSGDVTTGELATLGLSYPSLTYPSEAYRCSTGAAIFPGHIYALNDNNKTLNVYAGNPTGAVTNAPLATIGGSNAGFNRPLDLTLDTSGKIYVADAYNNQISVFEANPIGTLNEAPIATIAGSNTGLSDPTGIALDSTGKIYVSNFNAGTATVYSANPTGTQNETPYAMLSGVPVGGVIRLDSAGKIYMSGNNTVSVYAANPSGNTTPTALGTISGSNTGMDYVYGLALDSSGRIYVPNAGANTITEYAANPTGTLNETPIATIGGGSSGVSGPNRVAIDANGKVYVAQLGIEVFGANPSGSVTTAPLATINGGATAVGNVVGIAIR